MMLRNRHTLLVVGWLLLLSSCSQSNSQVAGVVDYLRIKRPPIPVPGATIASPGLQEDVVNTILGIDGARHQQCKNYGVKNTEVVNPLDADGKWKERWLIDRCGTPVAWDVEFTHALKGGTDIVVRIPKE
ncbi:MAG TPA: hypothetical protein VGH16_22615 [Candidatus Binatia bacterium]